MSLTVSDGYHPAVITGAIPRVDTSAPISTADTTPNNTSGGVQAVVEQSSTRTTPFKVNPNTLAANDVNPSTQPTETTFATVQTLSSTDTSGTSSGSGGGGGATSGLGGGGGSPSVPPSTDSGNSALASVMAALGDLFSQGTTSASAPQQDIGTVVPVSAGSTSSGINGKVIGVLAVVGVGGYLAYKKGWFKKLGIGGHSD